jgi:uncharacterized protein YlxP (DUF503 family)
VCFDCTQILQLHEGKTKEMRIKGGQTMITRSVKLTFYIPCAVSLKDKRRVCRSLVDKARKRFNASISEVDTQDVHRTLTIGVAVVSGNVGHAQRSLDEIIRYMEEHTDAELIEVEE